MKLEINEERGAFSSAHAKKKEWKIDEGLWKAIQATIPQGLSVFDVGAGAGKYVQALNDAGYCATGCDGTDGIAELTGGLVFQLDLAADVRFDKPVAWAMSIEVGEHIPQPYEHVYLNNLTNAACKGIILSWAVVNQRGRGHVNCHMPEWVASQMMLRHWHLDEESTLRARAIAGRGWNRKLMVFKR